VPKGFDFRTAELPAWLQARPGEVVLALHVQPAARRTAVVGPHGDRLKIAIASPPADGRANVALLEFLAHRLEVSNARVTLLSGAGSREKRVAVATSASPLTILAALMQ